MRFSHLHERDIRHLADDFGPYLSARPLRREVPFPSRIQDDVPLGHSGEGLPFPIGEEQLGTVNRQGHGAAELCLQELAERTHEMNRPLPALVDGGVFHLDPVGFPQVFGGGDVWVIEPDFGAGGADTDTVFVRVLPVQGGDGGRHHENVARAQGMGEEEFGHSAIYRMYCDKKELAGWVREMQAGGQMPDEMAQVIRTIVGGICERYGYPVERDDVAQDAAVLVLRKIGKVDAAGNPFSYITTCCRNLILYRLRWEGHQAEKLAKYKAEKKRTEYQRIGRGRRANRHRS